MPGEVIGMMDLISRQAILKRIEKIRCGVQMMDDTHRASIVMNGMHLCEEAVRNQPSAQPERKKGRWMIYIISMLDGEGCKCSECGFFEGAPYWDFCPNCGADMRGEQDD